ncbi:MAG: leucine-rich repeat domain-containing protein [Clostridia bacterium]|nr:leucine-rich repeat domain-containing protein [Clostridia bacterium]
MKKLLKVLLISILVIAFSLTLFACVTPEDQGDQNDQTDNGTGEGTDLGGDNLGGGNDTPITPTPDSPDKDGISTTENIFVFEENAQKTGFILKAVTVKSGTVVIPSDNMGKPVVAIAPLVFYSNDTLVEVTIPDTVESIGERAFSACYNLTTVNFGANSKLKTIGNRAFFNCERLESGSLPVSVKEIGTEAFMNCVEYSVSDSQSATLSDYTFDKLGYSAFHNTKWLNNNTLDGDIRIGKCAYAFTKAEQGQTYEIEYTQADTLTIAEKALYGAKAVTSVRIGAQITYIGEKALCNMPDLTAITVDEGNAYYASVGNCLIEKATGRVLAGVADSVIPTTATAIGREAFAFRRDITSLTISSSVKTIEPNAFEGSSLTSITLPESVTVISERVFLDCANLQSIHIKSGVTEIKSAAFNGCTSLKEVIIDSEAILELCIGKITSPAGLMAYAETVYVKEGMEASSPYLISNFSVAQSDKDGYIKYQINK